MVGAIVIKLDLGDDPTKGPGRGLPGSTRKNLKNIFEILIFHMKKLKNNSCKYRLYML
jgi:hypothetical protein